MEDILTSKLSIILSTNNEIITNLLIKIEELTQENNNIKNDMTVLSTIKNNQIETLINMNRI
jgi:hypothetical protein